MHQQNRAIVRTSQHKRAKHQRTAESFHAKWEVSLLLKAVAANQSFSIPVSKVRLEVDGCAEVVESAGSLASAKVHQAKVVAYQPLKGAQVECPFQAGNGSDVFLHEFTAVA